MAGDERPGHGPRPPLRRGGLIATDTDLRRDARAAASYLGSALIGGIAGGLLIGGLGSRLAMFVLRVTSDPFVVGQISDDGFEIGRLSSDTGFLLLFGTALGAAVGVLYLVTRGWLPARFRTVLFGILGGLVGGSGIVHAEGIDFRLLEPVWLAVVMFIAIPAAGGAAIAAGIEALLARRRDSTRQRPLLLLLPLLGLVVLGPVGIALAILVPLGIVLNRKLPILQLWTSSPVTWIGRAALALWATAGAIALVNDLRGIFTF